VLFFPPYSGNQRGKRVGLNFPHFLEVRVVKKRFEFPAFSEGPCGEKGFEFPAIF
jgi:hypothetical protein